MPHFVIEVFGKRETIVEADEQISAIEQYAAQARAGDIVGVAARPMRVAFDLEAYPFEPGRNGMKIVN
jgi:hypothetical protein